MAEENKKVEKEAKASGKTETSKWNKFVAWCKRLPKRIATPFKNMWYELKKVSWPSKHKLIVCSVIVLVFMLCMGVVIGLFDMGASALIRLLA